MGGCYSNRGSVSNSTHPSARQTQARDTGAWQDATSSEFERNQDLKSRSTRRLGRNIYGRRESVLNVRAKTKPNIDSMSTKPKVERGSHWTDKQFVQRIDPKRESANDIVPRIEWKRAKDISERPRFFDDTFTRNSVMQGQVGDCYLIATLSSLAQNPHMIRQILGGCQEFNRTDYTGIVHGRFCIVGEWTDVYTDDILPYNADIKRVYGGHSRDDDVFWVAILEKLWAKLNGGNYGLVEGGQKSLAFVLLTGGLTELLRIGVKKDDQDTGQEKMVTADDLFERVGKATQHNNVVLTNVDKSFSNAQAMTSLGLVSCHTYSITGVLQFQLKDQVVKLLKIRNPWGRAADAKTLKRTGEWKGRWSFRSREWKEVSEKLQNSNVDVDIGGEFWICLEDFSRYFQTALMCMTIPDYAEEGFRKSDNLNKVLTVLGEWIIDSPAKVDNFNKIKNPRFILTVPKDAAPQLRSLVDHNVPDGIVARPKLIEQQNEDDAFQPRSSPGCKTRTGPRSCGNKLPIVFQLLQQFKTPVHEDNNHYCELCIYKIEDEDRRLDRLCLSLTEVERTPWCIYEAILKCQLEEGRYLLILSLWEKYFPNRIEKTFSIRMFSSADLRCSQLLDYPIAMIGKPVPPEQGEENNNKTAAIRSLNVFGEWRYETAAGKERKTKMKNPRFRLRVQSKGNAAVSVKFQLRIPWEGEKELSTKLDVYKIIGEERRENQLWICLDDRTDLSPYWRGPERNDKYLLTPGDYILLPHYYEDGCHNRSFSLRILSPTETQCSEMTDNLVPFISKYSEANKQNPIDDPSVVCLFGEWVKDRSAGGQINHKTMDRNPQFVLSVSKNVQPTLLSLVQESIEPMHAIGCEVLPLKEASTRLPAAFEFITRTHKDQVMCLNRGPHPFVRGAESIGRYSLDPGRYLIIAHCDQPTDEKRFAILIVCQNLSQVSFKSVCDI